MPIQQAQFTESIHKMQLRLPASLHRRLEAEAGRRQMSMNALIVEVLDTALPHPKEVAMMMDIQAVLERFGDWAHGGNPAEVAREWHEAGFSAADVEAWLEARCFAPQAARELEDAGFTPALAATLLGPEVGIGGYTDTVGYKVSSADLVIQEAAEAVRNPGMCELDAVRSALGLVDWYPRACVRTARHVFYHVPEYMRGSVMAAHNVEYGLQRFRVCEFCAAALEELPLDTRWQGIDEMPDPFDGE